MKAASRASKPWEVVVLVDGWGLGSWDRDEDERWLRHEKFHTKVKYSKVIYIIYIVFESGKLHSLRRSGGIHLQPKWRQLGSIYCCKSQLRNSTVSFLQYINLNAHCIAL